MTVSGDSPARLTPALGDELLRVAVGAAEAGGAALMQWSGTVMQVDYKSSATDPVSEADRASERVVTGLLSSSRPEDGLLGEEGADRHSSTGFRWVIDPLDGTVNYLYGLPQFSVSIACEQWYDDDWRAVVGVVHDPSHSETFCAVAGRGARLGERTLQVNDPVPLELALVSTGFSYRSEVRRQQAAVLTELLPRVRDVRRGGSCALDLCWVASGRVDGYYENETARWDWSAGALIAAEAGAVVTPLCNGVVAAGPALHPHLESSVAALA